MRQLRVGHWRLRLRHMIASLAFIGISVLALAAPLAAGQWSLQFLSLFPFAVGLADLYTTMTDPELATRPTSYATGFLAIAAALLLYLEPVAGRQPASSLCCSAFC